MDAVIRSNGQSDAMSSRGFNQPQVLQEEAPWASEGSPTGLTHGERARRMAGVIRSQRLSADLGQPQTEPPIMPRPPLAIPLMALALVIVPVRPSPADDEGWMPLFDGKTLDGWKVNGGHASYEVEDGTIVGTTVEGSPNTFLCKGDYKDFVLELEVKCDPRLNSGVQVRSHVYAEGRPRPGEPQEGRGRLRPAVRDRPQGDRDGGAVLRRGPTGQVARRDQARGQGRLQGRRLEPLPDRRAGEPLSVVDQRDRRLRLHRRHGQERLHRPPGPRHRQGSRGRIRSAGGMSASRN